jgi:hypothetical protein
VPTYLDIATEKGESLMNPPINIPDDTGESVNILNGNEVWPRKLISGGAYRIDGGEASRYKLSVQETQLYFSKDLGGKFLYFSILPFPGVAGKTSLIACVLQKCIEIPVLLSCNLRQ